MRKENRLWYLKTYERLISSRLERGLDKEKLDFYTEVHHILPKCMKGSDSSSNLVLLTPREHILCHLLLSSMYPNNKKLLKAAVMMTTRTLPDGITVKISSRLSALFREEYSKSQKGRKLSEETKQKMSKSRIGHVISKETAQKISNSEKGKIISEDTRRKMVLNGSVNELTRKKLSDSSRERMSVEENRIKLSETMKSKGELNNTNCRKVLGPDGTVYDSLVKCAEVFAVNKRTVERWIKLYPEKGFSYLEGSNNKCIVGPDGKTYPSLRKCSEETGHERKTLKNWIENYPEKGFKYI